MPNELASDQSHSTEPSKKWYSEISTSEGERKKKFDVHFFLSQSAVDSVSIVVILESVCLN
jgi:hypothetical protein